MLADRTLQVVAAKGKQRMRTGGNTRQAQMAQQQMVRRSPRLALLVLFRGCELAIVVLDTRPCCRLRCLNMHERRPCLRL